MHLVPESAIIQRDPKRTFREMRQVINTDSPDIGCGSRPTSIAPRRRMASDASACNNSTNFFCWMSCRDIPEPTKAADYQKKGYSLYCLDPNVLEEANVPVSLAVEPCVGRMNPACMASWQPTEDGVAWQEIVLVESNVPLVTADKPFCYGGTSMYMDGFHWIDSTCIIYLFSSWVLTSRGQLFGASLGTIVLGILLELLLHRRRIIMWKLIPGRKRLAVSGLLYGLQLIMGYVLMLIIMTYSGPLFFSVIVGLVGGHTMFNAEDALYRERRKGVVDGSTGTATASEDWGAENVPDGFTPCCQNDLHIS